MPERQVSDVNEPLSNRHSKRRISVLGVLATFILRYGLAFVLLLWGVAKWTKPEAEAIRPLVAHSPVLSWIYRIASVQHGSEIIGCIELALAVLIVLRRWSAKASAVGSTASILMFLTTLSFLVTTPGLDGAMQGFLIKDVFLLGAAASTASEAWQATLENLK